MAATPGMQKLVNIIAKHLRTQKVQCKSETGRCRYRNDNLKCAIGRIIPDRLYNPDMEGSTSRQLMKKYPEVRQYVTKNYGYGPQVALLMARLQALHDTWMGNMWTQEAEEFLKHICQKNHVKYPEP